MTDDLNTPGGELGPPVPILRIFSEAEARAFYLRYLGFDPVFEHRFGPGLPLYMEVARDGCTLHLSEHHGDATPGARVRIRSGDLRGLLAELTHRGHPRLRPGIVEQPWGHAELTLTDPFGNRLTFWEPLPDRG